MTRALGHSMLSDFGVIWTPSVRLHRLAPNDCCLILASDGVWDVRLKIFISAIVGMYRVVVAMQTTRISLCGTRVRAG